MKLLTNSEMRTWRRCKRKWWLSHHRELRKRGDVQFNRPLGIGNRVHDALAAYYDPEVRRDPLEFLSASIAESLELFPEEQESIGKEHDACEAILSGYLEWLSETGVDQGLRVIEAERAVVADLVDGVQLLSKLDARVEHEELEGRFGLEHKGQPLDALVMTPVGPQRMGDLAVGDEVIGANGKPTLITAVQDLGVQDLLKVTFTDTSSIQVTKNHLWGVQHENRYSVRETQDLQRVLGRGRFKIPRTAPVHFNERELPIPPYTLGVLIGDGHLRSSSPGFSNADPEIFENVRTEIGAFQIRDKPDFRSPKMKIGNLPQYKQALEELGLLGLYSYEKYIPSDYLYASVPQRLALLQGLMDTDGCGGRQARFRTSSIRLANDMRLLVESFGGTFVLRESMGRVGTVLNGYQTRPNWCGTIQGIPDLEIHRVLRKQHPREFRYERGRVIKSIEVDETAPTRCIKVAAQDGLYVTEHFIVTHNTVSTIKVPAILRFDTQFLSEHLVELLSLRKEGRESEVAKGVLWNALLKSKRTARAKGPFYVREVVRHNLQQLRSHWYHVVAIANEIIDTTRRLDNGEDHHVLCHPNPTRDCGWDCPFVLVCQNLDSDPDNAERQLAAQFETENPLERYRNLIPELVESS